MIRSSSSPFPILSGHPFARLSVDLPCRGNSRIEDILNMARILRAKVRQHLGLARQLALTGTEYIIEDCSKLRPSESALFWGATPDAGSGAPSFTVDGQTWNGTNMLGKLWMALREDILFSYVEDVNENYGSDWLFELLLGFPCEHRDSNTITGSRKVDRDDGFREGTLEFMHDSSSCHRTYEPLTCYLRFNLDGVDWLPCAKEWAKMLRTFCDDPSGINPFF
jgi:hypothetical protein